MERAAEALPRVELPQPHAHGFLGGALHRHVDRGVDLEAELVGRRAAVALLEEPADVLHVPGRGEVGGRPARREHELLGERPRLLRGRDEPVLAHALEDVVLPRDRVLGVALRIVAARRLRQAGQDRRLRDGEVLDVGAEELARRGGHAVGARPEVDLAQVEVEDVVLGELRLEAERQDELLQLALVAPLRAEQEGLDHLLRDRAAALHDVAVKEVRQERARHALRVDAAVAVEVGVLGGEKREPHVLRDAFERDQVAALDVELADQRAVVRIDAGRDRRLVVQDLVDRRQVGRDLLVED